MSYYKDKEPNIRYCKCYSEQQSVAQSAQWVELVQTYLSSFAHSSASHLSEHLYLKDSLKNTLVQNIAGKVSVKHHV